MVSSLLGISWRTRRATSNPSSFGKPMSTMAKSGRWPRSTLGPPHHPRPIALDNRRLATRRRAYCERRDVFNHRNALDNRNGTNWRHAAILNLRSALALDRFLDQRQPHDELAPLPTPSLRPMTLPLWNSTSLRTRCSPKPMPPLERSKVESF